MALGKALRGLIVPSWKWGGEKCRCSPGLLETSCLLAGRRQPWAVLLVGLVWEHSFCGKGMIPLSGGFQPRVVFQGCMWGQRQDPPCLALLSREGKGTFLNCSCFSSLPLSGGLSAVPVRSYHRAPCPAVAVSEQGAFILQPGISTADLIPGPFSPLPHFSWWLARNASKLGGRFSQQNEVLWSHRAPL